MLRRNVFLESFQRPSFLLANACPCAEYHHSHWARWIYLVDRNRPLVEAGPNSYNCSTSPSVYVVYRGVSAKAGCSNIGNTYASVTMSYEPNELRTYPVAGGILNSNPSISQTFTPTVRRGRRLYYTRSHRVFSVKAKEPGPPLHTTIVCHPQTKLRLSKKMNRNIATLNLNTPTKSAI